MRDREGGREGERGREGGKEVADFSATAPSQNFGMQFSLDERTGCGCYIIQVYYDLTRSSS